MKKVITVGLVALALVGVGAAASSILGEPYRTYVEFDNAANMVKGGEVQINGFKAGTIGDIAVRDGKALIALDLDRDFAPLHDGAHVTVNWKALLGERRIAITDGPASNPPIPEEGTVPGKQVTPLELDQVLNALDKPTRAHLTSLVKRLEGTLDGDEEDLRATLKTLGPVLGSLGELLRAVGTDGPAIKNLVTRLNGLMTTLAGRDRDLGGVVADLSGLIREVASRQGQVRDSLRELPATLDQATKTLGTVPGTVEEVTPMLGDLERASARLPRFSQNLRPVLADLRPMVADLRPTLGAARTLLGNTPGLLDSAHAVVPGVNSAFTYLQPALKFLRPYTPELAGWTSTWGSAAANYDSNGHYLRMHVRAGATNANLNPGVMPPGVRSRPYPVPGEPVDQPWKDAFGDGQR